MTTDASPTSTVPVRCATAMRRTCHLLQACWHTSCGGGAQVQGMQRLGTVLAHVGWYA
jgi:hypothetical protein